MPTLLGSAVLARLPLGMNSLATVLYLQQQTGSFAIAGAAAGGAALGIGLGGIVQSRLVDRAGRRFVLPAAFLHAALLCLLLFGAARDAPAVLLVAAATAAGLAVPPTSSLLRTVYPAMLRGAPELLSSAFALDAVSIDFVWVAGPLLVAVVAGIWGAGVALAISAGAGVVGTAVFLGAAPTPASRAVAAHRAGWGGALRAPGVLTLTLSTVGLGFAFGSLEIALPAFAKAQGQFELAGVFVAILSVSSIAGTLAFGARPRRAPLASVHLWLGLALPPAVLVVGAASSALTMAVLVLAPGLLTGPLVASRNELTGRVADPGTETEAFMWPIAAIFTGTAAGAAVAGALVEGVGWRATVVAGALLALAGTLVAVVRRDTLLPRAGPAV